MTTSQANAYEARSEDPGVTVTSDVAADTSGSDGRATGPVSDGARIAAKSTTTITGTTGERETFIPVTRFAILECLTREAAWPPGEAATAKRFFRFLSAWRHQSYSERFYRLSEAYMPFSPDRDTVRALTYDAETRERMKNDFIGHIKHLLERANYRRLTQSQLDQIFTERSAYGLDLEADLSEFENVMIYCRGATTKTIQQRDWKKLWLKHKDIEVAIFQRLFLLLKLKPAEQRVLEIMRKEQIDDKRARKILAKKRAMLPEQVSSDFIYLKLFKQIPRSDIQMMFPNTKVQFRPLDKIKLGVTAGGGTIASVVSTASKLFIAANPIKAALVLLGLAGVIFRQVKKFFTQRNQYMMVLAQKLYFHNMADNRGVMALLSDRAEEEDIKEEMLLYSLLAKEPLHEDELGEAQVAIEQFLEHEFGVTVQFDLRDALSRLVADKVVTEDPDGMYRAMDPKTGCDHIDEMWDNYLDEATFLSESPQGAQAA